MCVAKKYQLGGRFWTIAIVIGVMVACVSGMFGFGSVLREAAERSGNVVGFAKSQSLTYDSFNDSVAMTSQVLALENASQLAHSISYGGDEVDQADLERAARLLGVSNAFVLTVDGQLVSSYSNNNVTFGMVQHEITADVALDVVDHPRKVYGTRIVFDDGSYIDVGCAARIDQAGMVVAGYYTSEAFSNRYMLSLQNMLAGYDVRGSGDIVVESDGSVVAANMVSDQMSGDIQLDPVDAKVVEDIKSRCQVGETTLLISGSKPYIASLDKARDYYVLRSCRFRLAWAKWRGSCWFPSRCIASWSPCSPSLGANPSTSTCISLCCKSASTPIVLLCRRIRRRARTGRKPSFCSA